MNASLYTKVELLNGASGNGLDIVTLEYATGQRRQYATDIFVRGTYKYSGWQLINLLQPAMAFSGYLIIDAESHRGDFRHDIWAANGTETERHNLAVLIMDALAKNAQDYMVNELLRVARGNTVMVVIARNRDDEAVFVGPLSIDGMEKVNNMDSGGQSKDIDIVTSAPKVIYNEVELLDKVSEFMDYEDDDSE